MLTIEHLRSKQWDKTNLWELNIDGKTGISCPAISVEIGFQGGEGGNMGDTSLLYPKNTTYPIMSITYVDTEDLDFTNYFRKWFKQIYKQNNFSITPINDAVRDCIVMKLNSMKIPTQEWTLRIYPIGQITYQGDSDGSSTPTYSLQFVVAAGDI